MGMSSNAPPQQTDGIPTPCDFLAKNMYPWSGSLGEESEATPSPNPTPKKKANTIENAARHGNRVRLYVESTQLRERLDTDRPTMHGNPETGFPEEEEEEGEEEDVIEIAKRGSEHVTMGLGEATTKAYNSWRSRARTRSRHGGDVHDMREEYYVALLNYGRRFATVQTQ